MISTVSPLVNTAQFSLFCLNGEKFTTGRPTLQMVEKQVYGTSNQKTPFTRIQNADEIPEESTAEYVTETEPMDTLRKHHWHFSVQPILRKQTKSRLRRASPFVPFVRNVLSFWTLRRGWRGRRWQHLKASVGHPKRCGRAIISSRTGFA